jgi:hypothetical protein
MLAPRIRAHLSQLKSFFTRATRTHAAKKRARRSTAARVGVQRDNAALTRVVATAPLYYSRRGARGYGLNGLVHR